ncbi:MAG: hypothetical protein ACXVDD_19330 [Polyangia bacterium]
MRTITMLLTATLLFCAGCPDGDTPQDGGPDMPVGLLCPANAEQQNGASCRYGHDTTCRSSPHGFNCFCACTGFWECDQVKIVCDPDAGTPGD